MRSALINQTIGAYNQARSDYQMALWQLEQAVGNRPIESAEEAMELLEKR